MSDQQDHLMQFVGDNHKPEQPEIITNIEKFGQSTRQKVEHIETTADSNWMDIELGFLPYNKFYKDGTHIFIRPAKTIEIESFAIVNDKNPFDVQLKVNELIKACTKIQYRDGHVGSYEEIQDGDRETLAILIARATAKNGRKIAKNVTCTCGHEEMIEFIPKNYVYQEPDPDAEAWFNKETKRYEFQLADGSQINLAPPSIGLASSINQYIFYKTAQSEGKVMPNLAFMQVLPYIKAAMGVTEMDTDQLENEEFAFGKMNDEHFMFIDNALEKINYGVKEARCNCSKCGKVLTTPFRYPDGARALLIIPNAFNQLIRKPV